jgi:hypothetical protein
VPQIDFSDQQVRNYLKIATIETLVSFHEIFVHHHHKRIKKFDFTKSASTIGNLKPVIDL